MLYLKNLQKSVKIEMFIGRKRGFKYENQRKQAHWGGGNSLKPSHINHFKLIGVFNNLTLWGENKFVSEQERTYKFKRGVKCHTENKSPKYRLVGKMISILRSFAIAQDDVKFACHTELDSGSTNANNRLRNKCAMTDVGNIISLGGELERGLKNELKDIESLTRISNAHIHLQRTAPSAQSADRVTRIATALWFPLSPTRGEGKEVSVGEMKENNFFDKFYSLFITQHSLKAPAFTLAEVLITLGIIGVVAAMTLPSLIASYQEKVIVVQAKKSYSGFLNTLNRMKADEDIVDYSGIFSTTETSLQKIENIAKYYNGAKVCTTGAQGCGSSYLVKLASPRNNGSGSISREGIGFPRILLLDGSLIYFRNLRSSCEPYTYVTNVRDDKGFFTGETTSVVDKRCATVVFDVNGEKKGPNQYGADVHQVLVFPEKLSFVDGNFGALKTIFEKDKLQYTKYSDSMTFDR